MEKGHSSVGGLRYRGLYSPGKPLWLRRALTGFFCLWLSGLLYSTQGVDERSKQYLQRGEYAQAIALLQEQVRKKPKDAAAWNLLGIALAGQERNGEAAECFQNALRLDPRSASVLENLGLLQWKRGERTAAVKSFRSLLRMVPSDEVAHTHMGIDAFEAKNYPSAIRHWQAAPSFLNKEPRLTLNLAGAYLEVGDFERARRMVQKIPHQPGNEALLFQAGAMLAQFRQYENAIQLFLSIREGFPDRDKLDYNLALAYLNKGETEPAREILEKSLQAGVQDPEFYRLLASVYEKADKLQVAQATLERAINLFPAAGGPYIDLASLRSRRFRDSLGGIETIRKGIEKNPNSLPLRIQLGIALFRVGYLEEAENEFELAGRLAPETELPVLGRSVALMRQGKLDEAIEILRRDLSAKPDDNGLLILLGMALTQRSTGPGSEDLQEAARLLEKSVKLNPARAKSHASLGKVYFKLNRIDAATHEFETAIKLDRNDVTAYYQLGLLFNKQGETAQAQQYMEKAAQVNREKQTRREAVEFFQVE